MPGKRSGVHRSVISKAQSIKTRLIEISLKVEDLVYNKKPITKKEAEMYMKEVNSYRSICCNDERSLQVIEKLTRCMKAIIAEQEELRLDHDITDDDSSVDDYRSSASPVYSLPDEDRIQLTQNELQKFADVHDFYNNPSNKITTDKVNFNEQTQLTQSIQGLENREKENDKSNEIIQLYDNNNIIYASGKNKTLSTTPNQDKELHKALSNLTITDTNSNEELMSIDMESSQSILHNIDPLQYLCSPPIKTLNFNNSEQIKSTKTANKEYIKLSNKTKDFQVNNEAMEAKSIIREREQKLFSDCENVDKLQQSDIIHFDFPNSNNNIIIQSNTKRTVEKQFSKNEKDSQKRKPVVCNNPNTILIIKNKTDSSVNSQAFDKKLKMRDQIGANILKYTNICKEPKTLIKSSSHIVSDVDRPSTKQANSVKQKFNIIKDNTNIYVDDNAKCKTRNVVETNTNMNNTMKHIPTKDKIKKNIIETKATYGIKKKRGQQRSKEDINKAVKKDPHIKKETQKRININDLNNKTEEYQPRRKVKKQSIAHNNIIDEKRALSIYSINVENDLSWLENIRFVREITEDEYDHNTLVDENFWDNYELPPHFDQNDFL